MVRVPYSATLTFSAPRVGVVPRKGAERLRFVVDRDRRSAGGVRLTLPSLRILAHLARQSAVARPLPRAAAQHSKEARMEGATRILGNHFHLLLDVCNPSKHLNIPKPGDQYAPQRPTEASTAFGLIASVYVGRLVGGYTAF